MICCCNRLKILDKKHTHAMSQHQLKQYFSNSFVVFNTFCEFCCALSEDIEGVFCVYVYFFLTRFSYSLCERTVTHIVVFARGKKIQKPYNQNQFPPLEPVLYSVVVVSQNLHKRNRRMQVGLNV
ncbi:uncharacterized protein isoform X1 [Rhodnius prolixus]|uniref:uncharacterized protein isoform X1 n=1 Tax=Rhodnius prolixus TaxID=13249 RepID=UPI003D18D779